MDWTKKKQSIKRLIKAKGTTIQLVKVVYGAVSTSTGQAAKTETTYPGYGLFSSYGFNLPENSIIKAGDKKVLIPALDLGCVPAPDDLLISDSGRDRIIAVDTLEPGGEALMFTVAARTT